MLANNQPAKILKAADLEMNLDNKEVKRKDHLINLTAKEFQLLEYLLINKNKVVSRNEISQRNAQLRRRQADADGTSDKARCPVGAD